MCTWETDREMVVTRGTKGTGCWLTELLADLLGLVVDLQRDLLELVRVLLAVMGAEEQVEPTGHGHPNVCLGPAAVTAIGSGEAGPFDDWCAHNWPRFPMIG
jgi:hypothetical protein